MHWACKEFEYLTSVLQNNCNESIRYQLIAKISMLISIYFTIMVVIWEIANWNILSIPPQEHKYIDILTF